MKFFVRAVVTGFALSLGAALFKKVQKQLGLEPDEKKAGKRDSAPDLTTQDGATDPGLRREYS
jgi:hypothetical protein